MKYMTCKVFKDVPKSEDEYLNMRDTIPAVLKALLESNDYRIWLRTMSKLERFGSHRTANVPASW